MLVLELLLRAVLVLILVLRWFGFS